MLVMVLAFGIAVPSYSADQGGILTITNIPIRFNGKFVVMEGYDGGSIYIGGAQKWDSESITGAPISNGKASIPLWIEDGDTLVRYAGNRTFAFKVIIYDLPSAEDSIARLDFWNIKFSNGSATVSFQDADKFQDW